MSLLKDIWSAVSGVSKGMEKTFDEQFDPVFTEMYPFVQPSLPPVSVQSLALIKNEDGSDRCVSCLACEKVCPSQVITIERKRNPAGKGFVLERFDIDLVNCMYCAACVEACPAQAIVTIQDFEMSTPNLQTLKADKDFLDEQGLRAKQWYSPKIGVEYRQDDASNAVHGKIVKAPIEEQPGGLQELEKARIAALNPAPVVIEALKPVIALKTEVVAPVVAETTEVENSKVKRFEPKPQADHSSAQGLISDTLATKNAVQDSVSSIPKVDDLVIIEGIGPKRAEVLVAAGISSFLQLSQTDKATLEQIMTAASLTLDPGIESWPEQAALLVKGDMVAFKAYTDALVAGKMKKSKKPGGV